MIKCIIKKARDSYKMEKHRKKWRKNNKHNKTTVNKIFNINKVKVGNYTYGNLNIYFYGNEKEKILIGNFCSIAEDTIFIGGGEHSKHCITTFPMKSVILGEDIIENFPKGNIVIEDDVWIGRSSTILSGVIIGQGSIVGANSTVSKNIPPYSIYFNNKIMGYRFSPEVINKLKEFDFSKINSKELVNKLILYNNDIEKFINSNLYKQNIK